MKETLYGIHPVLEALRAGKRRVGYVIIAKDKSPEHRSIINLARKNKIPVYKKSLQELESFIPGAKHQGVLAKVNPLPDIDIEDLINSAWEHNEDPFLMLADCVQDPHNLGAIIRSAEAAGCHGLIISSRRSVGLTPAVAKAAAGALEYLPIAVVNNSVDCMQRLKNKGFWLIGLHPEGKQRYNDVDLQRPLAIITGGEGIGLRQSLRRHCDCLATLPQKGKINSLNTSVATALMLYEVRRQRD